MGVERDPTNGDIDEGARMKATVVRYQARLERADENQHLIEAVFADLEARAPGGFTFRVFRLDDGESFVHVGIEHDVEDPDSLQDLWQHRSHFVTNTRWWPPFCCAVDWLVACGLAVMISAGVGFH